MKYLLDSNTFIQSHRLHHPFDVFPSFWANLERLGAEQAVYILDKVYAELRSSQDNLADWVGSLPRDLLLNSSDAFDSYQQIAQWATTNSQYNSRAKATFLDTDRADAWLVAYARKFGYTLVTWEVASPTSQRIIKIPDVCTHFSIPCINPIEMLRRLSVRI